MTLAFTKMQACGNDFVVIDDRTGLWSHLESELARLVCQRRFGIGADGLLILRAGTQPGEFAMRFINADGLVGEMCGNGARCLAAYLHRAGLAGDALVLESGAGPVRADLSQMPTVRLTLGPVTTLRTGIALPFGGQNFEWEEVDAGPPHVVCIMPSIEALATLELVPLGRFVRHHPAFAPGGCNVNAVAIAPDGSLHLRTYERGVEDETLGCGTGAVASAAVARRQLGSPALLRVITRSGEALEIDLSLAQSPTLTGPARFVADGHLHPTLLEGLKQTETGVEG